jgi:hypothetical protein
MKGEADVKGSVGAATTWALAITRNPFCCCWRLKIFVSHLTEPCAGQKEPYGKDPSRWGPRWGLVRTYTARALGGGGLEAPAFVDFEPGIFPKLYQTAHSESTVDKWNNFSTRLVAAGEAQSARDNRPAHGAKKATEPSAQFQNWPPQFAKSSSGLAYFFSSNLRQLSRIRHDRC